MENTPHIPRKNPAKNARTFIEKAAAFFVLCPILLKFGIRLALLSIKSLFAPYFYKFYAPFFPKMHKKSFPGGIASLA
ncbi:MAG: hypothetical protein IKU42_02595 [Oscillospiraceae bacterium]|nr:hypothetical protein [Oscillospiraceae bacterium]